MEFDLGRTETEYAYNIKWTILKWIQYIIDNANIFTVEDFPNRENTSLPDTHLYDSISRTFSEMPAFGVEFMGVTSALSPTKLVDYIYQIAYRGKRIDIIPDYYRFGVKSTNRKLLKIHDTIATAIEKASSGNKLFIHDFSDEYNQPRNLQISFSMRLIESSFPENPEFSRVNSIDWAYAISIDRA